LLAPSKPINPQSAIRNPQSANVACMFDRRRYISLFAVFALVLLRLAIGWHFFREGMEKVEYDRHDGELRLAFSADSFLSSAKGPLAQLYHSQAPGDHGMRSLLAAPRRNVPPDARQAVERAKWKSDYDRRRADAVKKGEPAPIEFPPSAPYHDWAEQIANDWRDIALRVKNLPGMKDEQKQQVETALQSRLEELTKYLERESAPIAEYRHELWRLENWRQAPEARQVPFHDERIAVKAAETAGQPAAWIAEVRGIEANYHDDLSRVLTKEQRGLALTAAALDDALADPGQKRLDFVNVVVTCLTIGVGVCLLLGLFTRLASIVGALFLLGVILSQPPWVYGATDTIEHVIEFAGLLVLAGTGAGRWLGLDFFSYALFNRYRRRDVGA
jgi:uncharacterized membrane protein YphA (DoxX/SURF4 family)